MGEPEATQSLSLVIRVDGRDYATNGIMSTLEQVTDEFARCRQDDALLIIGGSDWQGAFPARLVTEFIVAVEDAE